MTTDLRRVRERTLALVEPFSDRDLERQLDPIASPLAWDLGHIAAYEDLWLVHRYGARPLLRPDLAAAYDAFETPRPARSQVELLGRRDAESYLAAVRRRTLEVLEERGPHPVLHEMVLRHELIHTETMLQTMLLGGFETPALVAPRTVDGTGLELLELPGGKFEMGAAHGGFAFDNERPRHTVDAPPFRVARTPVTNATWLSFAEGGGYERREWWSDEGWAWKQEYDITRCAGAEAGAPDAPVCHVSWFEADAFARAHGLRLPSEVEWEWAATWKQGQCLAGVGRVWEWTSSEFDAYPGFAPHPYREYSEVFFRSGYPVLCGGSWATHPRVATTTFRNWDLPQRRQIFAGLRVAADAS